MLYFSLNKQSPNVSFAEAAVKGQAPDKGLYFPVTIPKLPASLLQNLRALSKDELGFSVMQPYVGDAIPAATLQRIVSETIAFEFPLVKVTENIASLELFHGPTLAFKDVGARFMSRCLGYFNRNSNRHTTVLVATSGDTGGAVANGFLGVEGVEVIILYPSGKVSPIQELQLTTCGQNITALEINGTFDDCQAMVKQAFTDAALQQQYSLTSANSINVARWLPQQLYYFFALQQWQHQQPPVIAVPSGNFGNICAGLLAHVSGLPVQHFIAALNANDAVHRYMQTGNYAPQPSVATVSNAMDVGNPSNFIRVLQLFNNELPQLQNVLSSTTLDDHTTVATIKAVYNQTGYTLDPHGAVAFCALQQYLLQYPEQKGFFLETAHPVKFPQTVEQATGQTVPVPDSAKHLLQQQKKSVVLDADYNTLKDWLLSR
ncbi:threonine synthase [Deminuibacter soli]|uniref:Threonine synthase n=1 Tax=Deminuibacter soli TaxID=2291815 RepID=A0A3E1NIB7_9BACT|nr:threonine synthase [Deminuibacter soli]RFM27528.1 threonine synthase [Deminuibacter soli]